MCFICNLATENRTKLKTHLLLRHSELNLCLFCVEAKGWSDTFASHSSYNDHYWEQHQGATGSRERKKKEVRQERQKEREEYLKRRQEAILNGEPLPKRKNRRLICTECKPNLDFNLGTDYDRHLIAVHGYDYCKRCSMMGNPLAVRLHVSTAHHLQLCPICCSLSPQFDSDDLYNHHLITKHPGPKGGFKLMCHVCPLESFKSVEQFSDHLTQAHEDQTKMPLKPMHRRRLAMGECDQAKSRETLKEDRTVLPPLERVTGLRNDSGQDCFSISILHLLAQTDLIKRAANHDDCKSSSCIFASFLATYAPLGKKRVAPFTPVSITSNYSSFGIDPESIGTLDCGDFLRECLNWICQDRKEHWEDGSWMSLFSLSLDWKFECLFCRRYIVTSYKDFVLKVDGSREASLDQHLDSFLTKRTCLCGHQNTVSPTVKTSGKYVFIEINRSIEDSAADDICDSKDLSLYSLRLKNSYNLFGFQYVVFATVNYNLEMEEGGHYVTNLFPSLTECTKVHEADVRTVRRKPDFDVDTVIVALKRVGKFSQHLIRGKIYVLVLKLQFFESNLAIIWIDVVGY